MTIEPAKRQTCEVEAIDTSVRTERAMRECPGLITVSPRPDDQSGFWAARRLSSSVVSESATQEYVVPASDEECGDLSARKGRASLSPPIVIKAGVRSASQIIWRSFSFGGHSPSEGGYDTGRR